MDELSSAFADLNIHETFYEELLSNGYTYSRLEKLSIISEEYMWNHLLNKFGGFRGPNANSLSLIMSHFFDKEVEVERNEAFLANLLPVLVKSSSLHKHEHFDNFLTLPPGFKAFVPNPSLRSVQHAAANFNITDNEFLDVFNRLRGCINRAPRFFRSNEKSETNFNRPVLNDILDLVASASNKGFGVISQSTITKSFRDFMESGYRLADAASRPELAITSGRIPIVVSEAKRIEDSFFVSLPQACQIAGDCAFLLKHLGVVPLTSCAVPGILTFGECVQFYGAFLIEERFPCFVLLSRPFHLSDTDDVRSIVGWIIALRRHIADMSWVLKRVRVGAKADQSVPLCADFNGKFLKPIRVRDRECEVDFNSSFYPDRIALTHILETFSILFASPNAAPFVHFPNGWFRVPSQSAQPALFNALCDYLESQCARYDLAWTDTTQPMTCLLVFDELPSNWSKSTTVDRVHTGKFAERLRSAVSAIGDAGIVHMDLRPANILWRCKTCVSGGGGAEEEHDVEVKVIDWEDSLRVGDPIPLVSSRVDDMRYPLAHCGDIVERAAVVPADTCLDMWFVEHVCEFLNVRSDLAQTFNHYMGGIGQDISGLQAWLETLQEE